MAQEHSCWVNAVFAGKGKLKCGVCGKKLEAPPTRETPRLRSWLKGKAAKGSG